MSEESA